MLTLNQIIYYLTVALFSFLALLLLVTYIAYRVLKARNTCKSMPIPNSKKAYMQLFKVSSLVDFKLRELNYLGKSICNFFKRIFPWILKRTKNYPQNSNTPTVAYSNTNSVGIPVYQHTELDGIDSIPRILYEKCVKKLYITNRMLNVNQYILLLRTSYIPIVLAAYNRNINRLITHLKIATRNTNSIDPIKEITENRYYLMDR
jgi:hypothetical protein